jgi:GNAT superfamily N-acetyltransferase
VATGSWYGCFIKFTPPNDTAGTEEEGGEEEIVGMGRIIGDGGWYFLIADIAVLPAHQRKGLGEAVLKHLLAYLKANTPSEGGGVYVSLFADEAGRKLYLRNGFADPMPTHLGMMMPKGWEERLP